MGRPPVVLDELRQRRILDAVRAGVSRTAQAACGHVSRALYLDWLARGRDGEQPYADFLDAVRKAEAEAEGAMVAAVRAAALEPKSWAAASWWLERSRPADWGRREATPEDESARAEATGESDVEVAESVLSALKSRKGG